MRGTMRYRPEEKKRETKKISSPGFSMMRVDAHYAGVFQALAERILSNALKMFRSDEVS